MDNSVISVKNFHKSFDTKKVIKDLSFDVYKGDIFAFLGANGSGKTTTIRTLLDIYKPDKGTLNLFGQSYTNELANNIGYLPEERGLYKNSKVLETLVYFGMLKGMEKDKAEEKALKYLRLVELEFHKDTEIKKLSSGQQQKIQLGITIINEPKLLILDEPTKGLDPVNRRLLLDILLKLNEQGSTILFSTHLMDEVEKIATRVLILKDGKASELGKIEEVKRKYIENALLLETDSSLNNCDLFSVNKEGKKIKLTFKENVKKEDVLKYLLDEKINIISVAEDIPTLEDIFIKICGHQNG